MGLQHSTKFQEVFFPDHRLSL